MYQIRLTPYSEIFYNEWLLDPVSSRYNISIDQIFYGGLDVKRLKKALKRYVSAHVILNSHIKNINGEPYWVPNNSIRELEYELEYIANGGNDSCEISKYINRSFDLYSEPLYRFKLLKIDDDSYRFIAVMHHLVADGSSSLDAGVFETISNYYNQKNYVTPYSQNKQVRLIANLVANLTNKLDEKRTEYKKFWHKKLSGIEVINLDFLKSSKSGDKQRINESLSANLVDTINFGFGKTEITKLGQIKRKYNITPYLYSLNIFAVLLHRYTNQNNLAVSYPIAIKEGIDFIYGSQINTNLIPYEFTETTTIIGLFNQSLEFFTLTTRNNIKYGYYPIADILQEADKHLLNTCFAQTFFREKPFDFEGINKVETHTEFNVDGVAKDVLLFEYDARNDEERINYRVRYDKKSFDPELLNIFVTIYQKLFIDILDDLLTDRNHRKVSSYNLLNAEQYHKIVYEFNQTDKDYPRDKTIHELFEEQVFKTPSNIAVVYQNTRLTYEELNQKANQLAHYLRNNYSIKPDDLIALCLDRSELMIIAMIGVLKSGGAYVPIDPDYPNERIKYILTDIKTKVVLGNAIHKNKLEQLIQKHAMLVDVIVLDSEKVKIKLIEEKNTNPIANVINTNLSYVIHTSGTTGTPKGVAIEHKSLVNFVDHATQFVVAEDITMSYINYSFDAINVEIYPTILKGGLLHILDHSLRTNLDRLYRYIIENNITLIVLPAIVATEFSLNYNLNVTKLRTMVVGGDVYRGSLDSVQIINQYGPTECTVCAVWYHYKAKDVYTIIGKPISNTTCYVMDRNLAVLPIGVIGELFIGGEGLARGYLNLPELTDEKFVSNPFQTTEEKIQNKNHRLYKTGDLVRILPDGNFEFIGRNDFQVKIRGHRIELKEIENKLVEYQGIKQAVVITKERIVNHIKDQYLLAYYVSDSRLNETGIQDYLLTQIPEYMLPQQLIYIDKLPLTANGKLNRDALPVPQFFNSNYLPPKTKLQTKIVKIWAEILNLPQESIGITDSFFKLGGNSMLAISLVTNLSKIEKCKNIKVIDIFKYTTIEQLTKLIDKEDISKNIISTKEIIETDIAIIAMSGEFSGCKNLHQYWDLIQNGREGLKTYTLEECEAFGIPEEIVSNPNFIPTSGHIFDIDKFDAAFWDLSPNEVKAMDPQIRKFLEHCWFILEMSGYLESRHNISIGVFAGSGSSNYFNMNCENASKIYRFSSRDLHYLNTKDTLATKVSYLLGLVGPANNISTACSTGLITVVEACNSLILNNCDMAIAGGVSLLMPDEIGHIYQEGMIYSKEKHCRVFDDRSSGIIHGSGVGVILLKRLSDARKDNDKVIAIIKGYASNNDGDRKMSYTSPSIVGQRECIINAQKMTKIASDEISYVECHGTGTKLGDPIEVQALYEAFQQNLSNNKSDAQYKCTIGSVKANIGHTDSAAGIAGLIKVCKMFEYKIIPKQINYDTPNSELNLNNGYFEIVTENRKWEKRNNSLRVAGVSSFGIGGTNAHIVLSEPIRNSMVEHTNQIDVFVNKNAEYYILPLSAKSKSSLEVYKDSFLDYLNNTTYGIEDIAYTLQLKRECFNYRLAITCSSIQDAIVKLRENPVISKITNNKTPQHEVVFMFPGQGNQYANMSIALYKNDQTYKKIVDKCIKLVNKYTDVPFEKVLFPALFNKEILEYDINQTQWAQPALFIIEYSLAKLLESLNVHAVAYIGHSIGEYVAATLAGVFDLEDAIQLTIARGELMQSMSKGAMLSIQGDTYEIKEIANKYNCEVAAVNSLKNCVVSGTYENINNLKIVLDSANIQSIILNVSHAYHSSLMNLAAQKFSYKVAQVKLNSPQKSFISNVTGDFIKANDAINPEYWANHIRSTVLLADGIQALCNLYENPFFIEIGPGKSLLTFVKHHNVSNICTTQVLNSYKAYKEKIPDVNTKEAIIAKLWSNGYNVDFESYYLDSSCRTANLPNYCFDSSSYWIDTSKIHNANSPVPTRFISENVLKDDASISDISSRVIEQNLPNKYYDIAKVFLDVLGIEKISIHDDLSSLNIDSLLVVSLVARLQKSYKISIDEFLKFQTIAKIAEFAPFIRNNFMQQLEKVKLLYAKKGKYLACDVDDMLKKQAQYLHQAEHIQVVEQKKHISNVLLTGATGHVGCNILYQLLCNTNYTVYLTVRAPSHDEAYDRINNKFKYYFDSDLENYRNKIKILVSNLEQPQLGISLKQYQELISNIDSIIHSAALVKHYGTYNDAYQTNVQSTINLLELSRLTATKDFHYISTIGVLVQDGYVPNRSYFVFHEDDDSNILVNRNNTYARTKYEGEIAVSEYRKYGITSNIYRLGNVAMHSTNYRHQENIEDNAFFVLFKTILKLGMMFKELSVVEVSPVDLTALAVVKLFDQLNLSDQTYHVFNPHLCDISEIFCAEDIQVKINSVNEFIDSLVKNMNIDETFSKQAELFMLHQRWLQEINTNDVTQVKILQDKTCIILEQLGFYWPKITHNMWSDIMQRSCVNRKRK